MTRREFDRDIEYLSRAIMLHVQRAAEEAHELYGITPPQGAVLMVLKNHGEMPVTELSTQLKVTKGSLSVLCKRMERQGLVVRRRSEKDERFVYISATQKGRELIEQVSQSHDEFYDIFDDTLEPKEKEEILLGLTRLEKYVGETADKYLSYIAAKKAK